MMQTTCYRIILFVLLFWALIACTEESAVKTVAEVVTSDSSVKDEENKVFAPDSTHTYSTEWVEDFKAFRDAVYRRDKKAVKGYFDFPMADGGELWYYVLMDQDPYGKDSNITKRPFTERDFNKYFDQLFPKSFLATLMKVKSKELATEGISPTPSVTFGKTIYEMYASVDSTDRTLRLGLGSRETIGEEVAEFSASYVFRIIDGRKLKFYRILLAG